MAPPLYSNGAAPSSTSLTPTTDNRATPLWKTQSHQSPIQPSPYPRSNGMAPRSRQPRPLTVNEALQYSPLTSIIPFDSGIIPLPNAELPTSQPLFSNLDERQTARLSLDLIDGSLVDGHGQSDLARHTFSMLQPLLNPNNLSEFKFKKLPESKEDTLNRPVSVPNNGDQFNLPQLGPFANMILNATEIAYQYPKSSTPQSTFLDVQKPNTPARVPKLPASPIISSQQAYNNISYAKNAQIPTVRELLPNPQTVKLQPMVIVPPLPASSHQNQYKVYHDAPSLEASTPIISRKRKLDANDQPISQTKDPRAISNAALYSLNELLSEIFEAENNAHLNGLSRDSTGSDKIFVLSDSSDGSSIMLTFSTHVKLEFCLQKVISLGRFQDVPLDHLCRLHKFCEGSILSAETIDINIDGVHEEDVTHWLESADSIELGLRSARTALRIMIGGREEKQVYPEELLQKILDLLRKVINSCIIPVVECRASGSQSAMFHYALAHKKTISQLLHAAGKIMQLLVKLLAQVELVESTVTTVEFMAAHLLFVENAHTEKDSVLGIHKFEGLRRTAMDMIAEVFSRYSEQRTSVFEEILTSLQKLPTTRQHARQFKLEGGKSIQLVSALIMRLIHLSAMRLTSKATRVAGSRFNEHDETSSSDSGTMKEDESHSSDAGSRFRATKDAADTESEGNMTSTSKLQRQSNEVKLLYQHATNCAQHVVKFFVKRASTASKTGDQPHRHLLDIFVEDLIAVLGLPEWPAADVLLQALTAQLNDIVESDKSTAPAKNMALELFGLMGCAISDMTTAAQHLARNLENDDSKFSEYLTQLMDQYMSNTLENKALITWNGAYRAVIESLHLRNPDDRLIASAEGYILTQWSKVVLWDNRASSGPPESLTIDHSLRELTSKLSQTLSNERWYAEDFEAVSATQCRLAYSLIVLNMGFCRAFSHLLKILLESIRSDQITVRARSLKSVTQMLEKDPTLLDRASYVIRLIISCTSDPSSMVRDSALALVGKCIVLKPALENDVCKSILACTNDNTVGIRKRSMRLLKDIYCRNTRKELKAVFADNLLQRARDFDEGVASLASQMFEEMWLSPFYSLANKSEEVVQGQIALKEQVVLVMKTVQRGENVISVLDLLLGQALSKGSKNYESNMRVCRHMVAVAFEGVIDSRELPDTPDQQHILQTLTVFAKAEPTLFTQSQLGHLQPYISNLKKKDDVNLFRSAVIILRCVLPTISAFQQDFLKSVQDDLLKVASQLFKSELNEVVACLWTINGELHNINRLVNMTTSILKNIHKIESEDLTLASNESRLKRFIYLASHFGKHCDFGPQLQTFVTSLPWISGDSVPSLIIESILPFTKPTFPLSIRSVSFDGIGMLCQAWPRNFNRPVIANTFQRVLRQEDPELQKMVLSSFRDFFTSQDRQLSSKVKPEEKDPPQNGKLGGSMTASDNDGAAALIAQGFLKDVLQIALSSLDSYALTATEVIASISRQGLVHPKECGPALVALETSTNPKIAEIAFQEHCSMHQQHESTLEREYMRAVQEAFMYQKNIVGDPLGAVGQPYRSKLRSTFEIIKTSKSKYQTKFLSNFCARIDFDLVKLDISLDPPMQLQYSRFLIENLAFFEYGRIDDLQHTIACMEKITGGTGASIAHAINTEIFLVKLNPNIEESNGLVEELSKANENIPDDRLRQLCTASMILSILWEARTFLRRLYGLNHQRRENKTKSTAKDLIKAPSKIQGVSGDKLMEAIAHISRSLDNHDSMINQCRAFAELLSIDNELRVPADAEDELDGRLQTPSVDEDGDTPTPASGGSKHGKRKGSVPINGTSPVKKKRGRPSLGGRKKSGKSVEDEEELYY